MHWNGAFRALKDRKKRYLLISAAARRTMGGRCENTGSSYPSQRCKTWTNLFEVRLHERKPLLDAAFHVAPSLLYVPKYWQTGTMRQGRDHTYREGGLRWYGYIRRLDRQVSR